MAPTERAMLPIRMTKLAPSEAMSSVAPSPVIAEKFRQLRKGGEVIAKTARSTTTTITGSQVPRLATSDFSRAFCAVAVGLVVECDMVRALSGCVGQHMRNEIMLGRL